MASVCRQMLRLYDVHYGAAVRSECGQLVSQVKIQTRGVTKWYNDGQFCNAHWELFGLCPTHFLLWYRLKQKTEYEAWIGRDSLAKLRALPTADLADILAPASSSDPWPQWEQLLTSQTKN